MLLGPLWCLTFGLFFPGYLYDLTQSPAVTVIAVGIIQAIGGVCLCCVSIVQTYQRKKHESITKNTTQMENLALSRLKEQSDQPFTRSVEHVGRPVC